MEQITSPIKAIRAYCLSCVCGNAAEVKRCELTNCPLHPFRFGKNPFTKRTLTEEQRQEAAKRLLKARENQKND